MAKSKEPAPKLPPLAVIPLSSFPRELLEQAYREIEANKARRKTTA
ncbi:hypothetical protein [Cohnella sp. JJ-181]|nr:hypothetical protein [Cohnella sp. JJ-181]CAI6072687.1 hypothetical protein COHCIP112018_02356 [Cohnella sp. JJ-181]